MPFKSDNNEQMPPEQQYKSYVQEGLQNRRIINRNIIVINDQNDDRILTERAPVSIDNQDNVYFRDLIIYLREQNLIQPGSSIFFYDEQRKVFVHQGTEPITANTMIPLQKFNSEQITIKYRPIQQSYYRMNGQNETMNNSQFRMPQQQYPSNIAQNSACHDSFFSSKQRSMFEGNSMRNGCTQYPTSNSSQNTQVTTCSSNSTANQNNMMMGGEEEDNNFDVSTKAIPREKRVKERKIGYVYERVMEWRKYYETGVQNEQGRLIKVNLDVAASMVGLSRKTLDDYYKYIRKAETYNFDFKGRSEEKIGVLRNFVRDRQKRSNKNEDDDVQVDDDNRETLSRQDEAGETVSTASNTAKAIIRQEEEEIEDSQNPRKQIQTQSATSTLPPPPPYSKEEENIYKSYQSNYQNTQESENRMRQTAPYQNYNNRSSQMDYERSEMNEERYEMPQNNNNNTFDEERYNAYMGADASAHNNQMDIEKCPQQQQNGYFNNMYYDFNNSFEMHQSDLHLNKQMSIPGMMNMSSFHNENQFNVKQEQNENRSFENFTTNGASPHDEEYCNFINDEAGMEQNTLQED